MRHKYLKIKWLTAFFVVLNLHIIDLDKKY